MYWFLLGLKEMRRILLTRLSMLVAVLLTILMGLGVYIFYRSTMIESEKKDDGAEEALGNDKNEKRE